MNKDSLTQLHWYHVPGLPSKLDTMEEKFFQVLYEKTCLKKETPAFIYMLNGQILDLGKIRHDNKSARRINKRGLHIFLYEPLCSKKRFNDKHNQSFYSEFLFDQHESFLVSDELESIKNYVASNGLTNVTVHTGDYNAHEFYRNYLSYFNIVCDDLFLKNQIFLENLDDRYTNNYTFPKNFICLNWRYTKHRQLVSAYLDKPKSNLSWYYKSTFNQMLDGLWFDILDWKESNGVVYDRLHSGVVYLNDHSPLCLDLNLDAVTHIDEITGTVIFYPNGVGSNPALSNHRKNSLLEFYNESFCDVITESRYAQPTANLSEKTLMAVHYRRPFVLVGPPKSLEYFRLLGFKTFSNFWDESYDDEWNHEQRLLRIFKVIDWIENLSIDEKKYMYMDMLPIINHNRENLKVLNQRKS